VDSKLKAKDSAQNDNKYFMNLICS
jgi:hypothetical protein